MSTIVQLSDLHLFRDPSEQGLILGALVQALERDRQRRGETPDLLTITGDVFESATLDPARACAGFLHLHEQVQAALGGPIPTIVIPGNHDRRRMGLFGPHRDDLFSALREALKGGAWVHGTNTPFLSSVVPNAVHGQPFFVVAYDSTYLPVGLVSAGGLVRQEDILQAASIIQDKNPDWPLVFLLHHHLVPTPLTDLGAIEVERTHRLVRWSLRTLLPGLVANADREELTMTALGAGTALSTLHAMNRAVLILHGHKHYATVRLLDGIAEGQGDILLVSAGSSGTAQAWNPTSTRDVARLWPSFNVINLSEAEVMVETVAFGWKGSSAGKTSIRPLVRAEREGAKWRILSLPTGSEEAPGPRLEENRAAFTLEPSRAHGRSRWDYRCRRLVKVLAGTRLKRYIETIEALDRSFVRLQSEQVERPCPAQVPLTLNEETEYWVSGALARTLHENGVARGLRSTPFEWVYLMNRYQANQATLELEGLSDASQEAFGSATDLGTGLERPMRLSRSASGRLSLRFENCPARTLLRIYWPLERIA